MRLLLPLAFVTLIALPAQAQVSNEMPVYQNLSKVPIGAFSKYKLQSPDGRQIDMQMGVVGKEGKGVWLESALVVPGRPEMRMKMLVGGGDEPKVDKVIVQIPGQKPMSIPGGQPGTPKITKPDAKGMIGKQKVKVAAGEFDTKHFRRQVKAQGEEVTVDTWVADGVHPLSVVKMEITKKGEKPLTVMELVGQGKDFKTQITEAPVDAPTPPAPKKP
jgi:hypothetical protein